MKLKQSQIRQTRENLLLAQVGCCALCGGVIDGDPVLDHDHKSGAIRATLHRGCNALLGKVENNAVRNRVTDLATFLRGAASYLEAHSSDQTGMLHPTHFTQEEKLARRKAKAKKARAAKNIDK